MNKSALSPVLATVCLATMSLGSIAAVETELQLGPTDFRLGAELVNKHYDQGILRNNDTTVVGHLNARLWDIGVHADWYTALNGSKQSDLSAGETTQINLGADYLIEVKDLFQIIPHYEYITYPNLPAQTPQSKIATGTDNYKSEQHWVGLDMWYMLPWQGLEVGAGFDYNLFYDAEKAALRLGGGSGSHALRGAIAARQFYQNAPLDIAFYQVLNFGNGEYKRFAINDEDEGLTTLDIGIRYVTPFFLDQLWMTAKLEAHMWLEADDRKTLRDLNRNNPEIVMGIGFEWKP